MDVKVFLNNKRVYHRLSRYYLHNELIKIGEMKPFVREESSSSSR